MGQEHVGYSLSLCLPGPLILDKTLLTHDVPVMKPGVREFMDSGFHCLDLAHPVLDNDLLVLAVVISLGTAFNLIEPDRNRGDGTHGIHEDLIVFRSACKLRNIQFRERVAGRLCKIKYFRHFVMGNRDLHLFCLRLSVSPKDRLSGPWIQDFLFRLFLIGSRRDDRYSLLSLHDLPVELFLPVGIACHMRCRRHLHSDQQDIVGTVMVELCHCFKYLFELRIV